eukprot:220561_1
MTNKTSRILQFESIWSICSLLICILLAIFNTTLIKKTAQTDLLLHATSIISMIGGILSCIWFSFFGNNWIHLVFNISYTIISDGNICNLSFRLNIIINCILYYSFCMVILSQIRHLLLYLPSNYHHQMKDKSYTMGIFIVLFILFCICLYTMYYDSAVGFAVQNATDDMQYKYCFF